MSTKDFIKKSVLNAFTQYDAPKLAVALLAALALVVRKRRPLLALGIAWFLGAQLLTATIVPLELVFEHRNYFASLGVCLAVADLLLLAPRSEGLRRLGALLALLALLALGLAWNPIMAWCQAAFA